MVVDSPACPGTNIVFTSPRNPDLLVISAALKPINRLEKNLHVQTAATNQTQHFNTRSVAKVRIVT